jgi:hypothetical protein
MNDFESPVDLPDAPQAEVRPLGLASGIIAVAAGLLLLFDAASLAAWVDEQPPGPTQAEAARIAHGWHDQTVAWGLAAPRATIKSAWEAAKAERSI